MNTAFESLDDGRHFDEFQYRLLYLKPNAYSDERLVVGLVAAKRERLEAKFICAPAAMQLMASLFGEEGVEQFHFATNELRQSLSRAAHIETLRIPTNLLVAGEILTAFTPDRDGLLTSILSSSSSLVRSAGSKGTEALSDSSAAPFTRDLFEQMTQLNPLVADKIFNKKITVETGDVVELPILGKRIFGAPVSFAAKDQRTKAEAYVAKFHWLRPHLPQEPRVYLLAPNDCTPDVATRLDPGIRELRAIAAALHIPVRVSESTQQMATAILQDEAA